MDVMIIGSVQLALVFPRIMIPKLFNTTCLMIPYCMPHHIYHNDHIMVISTIVVVILLPHLFHLHKYYEYLGYSN